MLEVRTFDEYVAWMVTNSPHMTLADWWRRVEFALVEFASSSAASSRRRKSGRVENALAVDPRFGLDGIRVLRAMRQARNRAVHEQACISAADATAYARLALDILGALGGRGTIAWPESVPGAA